MRILIVVLIIAGAVFYGYKTMTGGGPRNLIKGGVDKLTNATMSGLDPNAKKPVEGKPLVSKTAGAAAGSEYVPMGAVGEINADDKPQAMQIVRFVHREPPAAESVTIATSVGCILTVDSIARTVVVVGPAQGVDIVKRYLEAVDQPAGSCAVRSWAVYVDKSVKKGFDLAAVIGAAVKGDFEIDLGGGGLTLDLGADEVALALTAICDGSAVEVVQRPHVQLFQGVTAKIESIQEVPVPSTTVSQGIAQTSIDYRKVGLQLEVQPYFLGNNRLRLGVSQTNGLIGRTVEVGGNDVPIIETQSVSSSVELAIGQTVILGGVTTLRHRMVKGLLRNQKEITEGTLYVIISTYFDVPRAVVVGRATDPLTLASVPLLPPVESAEDWINDGLLPDKSWGEKLVEIILPNSNNK